MPMRMLVVDDEEAICFALRRYFLTRGFQVDTAQELEEAQALLVNGSYDIVIVDLRLTETHQAEGLNLLSYLREYSPQTRAILLTAYANRGVSEAAAARGAGRVLKKPVALPELGQAVTALLAT